MAVDIKDQYEVVLERRVVPQPVPALSEGGDCAACVLAGVTGLSLELVVAELLNDKDSVGYFDTRTALEIAHNEGLLDRVVTDMPMWVERIGKAAWGHPSWANSMAWFEYVQMAIDAGYYALASISFDGGGPLVDTDHAVLICGVKQWIEPHPTVEGAGRYMHSILVSCSAKSSPAEYWIDAEKFLTEFGGFNVMLARPAKLLNGR